MKIQYASDLHLEFEPTRSTFADILRNDDHSDILVLGGDICVLAEIRILREFLCYCAKIWNKVFYIPGNHEYYGMEYHEANTLLEKLCLECSVEFALFKIHTVRRESKDLCIIMTTLWSNVPVEHEDIITKSLNDYSLIRYNRSIFTPKISSEIHRSQKLQLFSLIDTLRQNDYIDIVIFTHHAPLMLQTSAPHFNGRPTNHAFATDCSVILDKDIKAWIFGHTHYNNSFYVKDTLFVSNQRGYNGNCPNYKISKTLTL
jgi:predicted MPP superfamily phosphohydrolase